MKKLIPLVLFVIAATGQVFAIDGEKKTEASNVMVITLKESKIIKLVYDAPAEPTPVSVKIYDSKGEVIFSEKIKNQDDFVRPYNLSNLNGNDYRIEVTDGASTFNENISFIIEMDAKIYRKALVANFKGEKNKYQLVLANNADQEVEINIYSGEELIYKSIEHINNQFTKVYDLSRFKNQDIKFEVIDKFGIVETAKF